MVLDFSSHILRLGKGTTYLHKPAIDYYLPTSL